MVSPSPTASFAGSSAASCRRRPRPSPDSHVTLNEVKGLNRNEILRSAQNDSRLHSSQQALRVHIHVVAEPPYSPALLHFRERRLHGLPQRRPVQTLHRELPTHATARAGRGGRDRTQYFEVWRMRARAFSS